MPGTLGRIQTFKLLAAVTLGSALIASSAQAVVYCKSAGLPQGCVARLAAGVGVAAPGAGGVDPGINQRGVAGNVGARRAADVGAPGAGAIDPGINQPGAVGNTGVRVKRVAPR